MPSFFIGCMEFKNMMNQPEPEKLSDFSQQEIKVSVVVVCYNQEETISRTLDSVISQKTDFPFEIIIGEDFSADSTLAICEEYAKKYPDLIRLVKSEANKGLINNYYDCVLSAKGKYISDLGGDDFWTDENKLQIEADTLDRFPDVSLVHTDWRYFDESTGRLYSPWGGDAYPYLDKFAAEYPPFFLLKHVSPVPVHLCTAMYRKDVFMELYNEDEFLFRNRDFFVEDLQLIVMLATLGRFIFINRPTLAYSQNVNSISCNRDLKKQFDLYLASMKLTRYLELKIEMPHEELIPVYQSFSHFLAMQAFNSFDQGRMRSLRKEIKKWEAKPLGKTRIILGISSFRPLWKVALGGWKLYRKYRPKK